MKKHGLGLLALSLLYAMGATQLSALPMFTKQTSMECAACHTQQMPRLNKLGRKFAASGMTISKIVEDSNKSTIDINPSFVIKSKYAKTWDKPDGKGAIKVGDTNDGDVSIVRMATLYLGGQLSEDVGAIVGFSERKEEGTSLNAKIVYAKEIEGGYWGSVLFSTPSFGPYAGMEFYNTGLYKPLRLFDMRIYSNAVQAAKIGAKNATGLQVYIDKDTILSESDHLFATLGIYAPAQDNIDLDIAQNLLPFARVAYEFPLGKYNFILGAFAIVGGDEVAPTEDLSIKVETYGIDLQIEGEIAGKELLFAFTNVSKHEVTFTGIGAGSTDDLEDSDNDAFSAEASVALTPDVGIKAAYMTYNDLFEYTNTTKINVKDLEYAINLGVDYTFEIYVPMKVAVEYAWMKPELDRVKEYESFMVTLTLPL